MAKPVKYSNAIIHVNHNGINLSLLDWAKEIGISQQAMSRYYTSYKDDAIREAMEQHSINNGAPPMVVFGLALAGKPFVHLLKYMKTPRMMRACCEILAEDDD